MKADQLTLELDASTTDPRVVPLASRLSGIAVLATVAFVVVGVGSHVVYALRDAWVAPLRLAPEQDVVLAARGRLEQETARYAQLRLDIAEAEASIAALDRATSQMQGLLSDLGLAVASETTSASREATAAAAERDASASAVTLLESLLASSERELTRAKHARAAGLVTDVEVEAADRVHHQATIALESGRQRERLARVAADATRARASALGALPGSDPGRPIVRESFDALERRARIELEIARMGSERRGLEGALALARANARTLEGILADMKSRPIYRAIEAPIDVVFIPYDQLEKVHARSRVLRCMGGVAFCQEVGRVLEVVPGEVATEGPFGERERGQYAVVRLTDPRAHHEATLRIRD
jgi:hypothetical protein